MGLCVAVVLRQCSQGCHGPPPHCGDQMDPLASTGFGLSSCPGGAEKGEVICREGVSLLLGQVRTDRLRASQLERGQEPRVFPSLVSPRGFPKHCGETHHVPQAAQCKASVGGLKCRGGDRLPPPCAPLPLQAFPELFQDLARLACFPAGCLVHTTLHSKTWPQEREVPLIFSFFSLNLLTLLIHSVSAKLHTVLENRKPPFLVFV